MQSNPLSLTCPQCQKSYHAPANAKGDSFKVRCKACSYIWTVQKEPLAEDHALHQIPAKPNDQKLTTVTSSVVIQDFPITAQSVRDHIHPEEGHSESIREKTSSIPFSKKKPDAKPLKKTKGQITDKANPFLDDSTFNKKRKRRLRFWILVLMLIIGLGAGIYYAPPVYKERVLLISEQLMLRYNPHWRLSCQDVDAQLIQHPTYRQVNVTGRFVNDSPHERPLPKLHIILWSLVNGERRVIQEWIHMDAKAIPLNANENRDFQSTSPFSSHFPIDAVEVKFIK